MSTSRVKEEILKDSRTLKLFPKEESCSQSPNMDRDSSIGINTEQMFECPFCAFRTCQNSIMTKHTKQHFISQDNRVFSRSEVPSESAYCDACNIQFMSPKTYRVHRELYCKSRHEATAISDSGQFEMCNDSHSNDCVVLPGTKHQIGNFASTNGILSNIIHPQAIFAAISTDPLILLPCSLVNNAVNGQGLVPQSSLISTGMPIVLPTGISNTVTLDNATMNAMQFIQPNTQRSKSTVLSPTRQPKTASKSNVSDHSKSESKTCEEIDVLNLTKHEESNSLQTKDSTATPQEGPLDLTVRKRKTSCFEVQRSDPRPIVKRRNSFASTTSPTISLAHYSPSFSKAHCSSPEPQYHHNHSSQLLPSAVSAVSPPTFSNDASSPASFGSSSAPTVTINDFHGFCNAQDVSSSAQSALLPNMENSRRATIPLTHSTSKLMKQGDNKCEECNIVFFKYDNYLAHKKHYCAYRRRQLADQMKENFTKENSDLSLSDDNSNNECHSESKKHDSKQNTKQVNSQMNLEFALENFITIQPPVVNKPTQSATFKCDACGVKFSTADNLNAHQTYYCSRKVDFGSDSCSSRKNSNSRDEAGQCSTCEESVDGEDLCYPEEWKCNYCEVVCPSLKAARKHLLTHSEIRGFCCIVCGYRGNTLRGMRSHVYEHLNGDISQIEDILASSVVVDPAASGNQSAEFSGEENSGSSKRNDKLIENEIKNIDSRFNTSINCKVESPHSNLSDDSSFSPRHNTHVSSLPSESPTTKSRSDDQEKDRRMSEEDSNSSVKTKHHKLSISSNVLIKMEADQSPTTHDETTTGHKKSPSTNLCSSISRIKDDPSPFQNHSTDIDEEEEEIDIETSESDKTDVKVESNVTSAATSVICRVSSCRDNDKTVTEITKESAPNNNHLPKKRKLKTNAKPELELKYCKSCDITFRHPSNFITHKQFYCVSRVREQFQQEAAPVQ